MPINLSIPVQELKLARRHYRHCETTIKFLEIKTEENWTESMQETEIEEEVQELT